MFRSNFIVSALVSTLALACGYSECETDGAATPTQAAPDAGTPPVENTPPVEEAPAEEPPAEEAPTQSEPPVSEPPVSEPPVEEPPVVEPPVEEPPVNECGDGVCNADCETYENCSQDCSAPEPTEVCGNGECELYETHDTCAADCEAPAPECFCGDGNCDTSETPLTCSQDCGSPEPTPTCGDGTCNGDETQETCSDDCGSPAPACSAPDVVLTHESSPRTLWLSTYYVGGNSCIIVESDSITNNGWGSSTQICDTDDGPADGYVAFTPPSNYNGTSRLTFRALAYELNNSYADYGVSWQREALLCNSDASLAFVGCPWYSQTTGGNSGSSEACDLYATWTSSGVSGNVDIANGDTMGNYHQITD